MCERHPDRDQRGRILPGRSGNPRGRPAKTPYLRLLEAAKAAGADVILLLPPPTANDPAPPPPAAA